MEGTAGHLLGVLGGAGRPPGAISFLKHAKMAVLRCAETAGLSNWLAQSAWRRRRLLILCYHGVSRYDEHEWAPLYISPGTFQRRMELLAEARCNVLLIGEALSRLRDGTLPDRAVAITFDDGVEDFYSVAFPILEEFGYRVTLYLTTYYVEFNRPVFDPMCSYLLWKGRDKHTLEWPEILRAPAQLDAAGRERAAAEILRFAVARKLSAVDKDNLLAELAERLDVDYRELCRRRVLHLITPEEAKELAGRGVDVEYHTHRHRAYRSREGMLAELEDNRRRIVAYGSREPSHACYTSGFLLPEHPAFLKEYGMASATTCFPGLCTACTDPMHLPRLVDTMSISEVEFRAWLAGTASLVPHWPVRIPAGQLADE